MLLGWRPTDCRSLLAPRQARGPELVERAGDRSAQPTRASTLHPSAEKYSSWYLSGKFFLPRNLRPRRLDVLLRRARCRAATLDRRAHQPAEALDDFRTRVGDILPLGGIGRHVV